MGETVFIVVRDYGYEGFSEPLAVFATRHLADIVVQGVKAGDCTAKVVEMPVISAESLASEKPE